MVRMKSFKTRALDSTYDNNNLIILNIKSEEVYFNTLTQEE